MTHLSKGLSEISYSLYLFHFPLVLLIYGYFYKHEQATLNIFGVTQYVFWLITLTFFGYAIWWAFERRTPLIRQHLQKYLGLG